MSRWLLVLFIALTGCVSKPSVLVNDKPLPPRVDCQQPAIADPPEWPVTWAEYPEALIVVLGLLEQSIGYRKAEHDCIARLKARGDIR